VDGRKGGEGRGSSKVLYSSSPSFSPLPLFSLSPVTKTDGTNFRVHLALSFFFLFPPSFFLFGFSDRVVAAGRGPNEKRGCRRSPFPLFSSFLFRASEILLGLEEILFRTLIRLFPPFILPFVTWGSVV